MSTIVSHLAAQVQRNCDISDARHAGDYTLCTYLLKMREYFRWEKGYRLTDRLPKEEVGAWLQEREQRWGELEGADYGPVEVNGTTIDPFDSERMNALLRAHGLIYSGGYGAFGKPHFFLAERERTQEHDDYRVHVSGTEYARDLTAPPAMLQHTTIFVRRESVRRMVWEKMEEWQWRRGDTPMGRAAGHYPFEAAPEDALDAMTSAELEAIVLHEQGERAAARQLGERWEEMLTAVTRTKAEYLARAARDHLADSLSTLPHLVGTRAAPSIHFYLANLTGLRRELFPSLAAAYQAWSETGDWGALEGILSVARPHWEAAVQHLLATYDAPSPAGAAERLEGALPRIRL